MSLKTKTMALAVGVVAAGGLALAASPAHATTGTCLGEQFPTSGPVSCGGLFLPGMNTLTPSGQPNSNTLSLTTFAGNYWNAPLSFHLYSASDPTQDFTVYERCNAAPSTQAVAPSDQYPCGGSVTDPTSNTVYNAASNKPEFVAEVTPLGAHLDPSGLLNKPGNLCISWEALPIGPRHKYRFAMVERTCNSLGATFYPKTDDGLPSGGTGISGTVVNPNRYQTFAPIPGNGGDLIANEALSNNFHNLLYVVDDQGVGYPSGNAILYPENDQKNQIAKFAGCNGAVITTGVSYACP